MTALELVGAGNTALTFQELPIQEIRAAQSQSALDENYLLCRLRCLPELFSMPGMGTEKQERIAICAGGPSLADFEDEIRSAAVTMACGSAVRWFRGVGIKPDYIVNADGDQSMVETLGPGIHGVRYLLASTSHPSLFDALRDHEVWVWNNLGAVTGAPLETGGQWIGGGGTVTTRAINIAGAMGYHGRDVYGFDCAFRDDAQHAYHAEPYTNLTLARCEEGGRVFITDIGFYAEAVCYREMLTNYGPLLRGVTIHGDGLVAEMLKVSKRINEERIANG